MIDIQQNIPLAPLTTLKIGGPARYFVEVHSVEELIEAVSWAKEKGVEYMVIAGGSNLLVSDDGYDGLIIRLTLSGIEETDRVITVKAGTPLQQLVDYTIEKGLNGMSTMTGIPGSVGGAVYGSAGAYGDNIRDYLKQITCFDGENIVSISKVKYDTGYRDSIFKKRKDLIILEASFSDLPKTDVEDLKKEAAEVLEKRKKKYNPVLKTPGSFFKNIPEEDVNPSVLERVHEKISAWEKNPDYIKRFGDLKVIRFGKIPAGNLIDMLGGKGDQLGQIKIDEFHANTFINLGEGTAEDFFKLAKKWKNKVKEEFGLNLEPEVQLIGFKDDS